MRAKPMLDALFEAMQHGGPHGIEDINHFNGGLFDDRRAFDLQADELRILVDLGRLDWDQIDLAQFRRGLEVELEHGAHDPQTNVTNDDVLLTGRLAWAHLKEIRDYYTRLDRLEAEAKVQT